MNRVQASPVGLAQERDEALSLQPASSSAHPLPTLPVLLQAVLERVQRVEDGHLIELIEPAWKAIAEALSRNPELAYQLTAEQWEQMVAASYKAAGFHEVILTPRSGDLGRDVIAVRRGFGCVRIIDQVKAYKPGHLVTADDVRATFGVLSADPRATKAIVSTTSDFAPRVSEDRLLAPYMPYRLELVNGEELLKRLAKVGSDPGQA